MQESGSEKLFPEHAEAAAALWDATLRGYAYDTGELVDDLYRQYRTEYRGGKLEILRHDEDGLEQAMYRNTADIKTFIEKARAGIYDAHPSFVGLGDIADTGHRFDGFELQLFSDNVKHTEKHEDNWENILYTVTYGECYDLKAKAKTTGNASFLCCKRRDDGKIDAVVVSPRSEKNKTLAVVSAWKTNETGIEEVLRRAEVIAQRKTASVPTTGGSPAYPSQQRGALTDTEAVYEKIMSQSGPERNELFQGQARGNQTPIVVRGDELGVPEPGLRQERNSFGVPLSRVTKVEESVRWEELDEVLSALAGKELPNLIEDVTAQVNANQKRKIMSAKAREKSIWNGFGYDEHQGVAAQIANAWKWAAQARGGKDQNNMPDVRIRRYVSALNLNGQDAFAWITVKETPKGLRIYSVELMDEKKLRGSLGNGTGEAATTTPSGRSFKEIIARLNRVVNEERPTFHQGKAGGGHEPIVVRGDELGVPEGAEIKEYRQAAREVYRELQRTPAHREDLGEIRFSGDGFRKMQQAGADKRKWQLVPKLKELVENADYIRRDELYKTRRDGVIAFHWLETDVELNGEKLRVGFNIGEDAQGNKFYNLNHDLEEFRTRKEEALAGHLAHNRGPQTELPQGATAPVEDRIPIIDDGVNLYILSEAETAEEPRARVLFGISDAYAVVEFFKAADPSSAPHERYHIFRRIMSELYEDPKASEASRERYRRACAFVGTKPGRAWTPEQEERFARAGERFLWEGESPNPRMRGVMESFRQWLGEIYGNAERSGLEISDRMREVFGAMLGTAEDGDLDFRYAMGRLLDYRPEASYGATSSPGQGAFWRVVSEKTF